MVKVYSTDENVIGHAKLQVVKYVRLLFYGGAKKPSHNSAFYFASLNVENDYADDGKIIRTSVDTAKKIVDAINEQQDNSIQSLDIFSHGDPSGIFFIKGSSVHKEITTEEVDKQNLDASLFVNRIVKFKANNKNENCRIVDDIQFSKFTKNCKVELHGCRTCETMYILDNMCEELSELLYDAGKTESVVIGHAEKANPNIEGPGATEENATLKINNVEVDNPDTTTIEEQDYRQGTRCVFNNGEVIWTTRKKGRITASEIKAALKSR